MSKLIFFLPSQHILIISTMGEGKSYYLVRICSFWDGAAVVLDLRRSSDWISSGFWPSPAQDLGPDKPFKFLVGAESQWPLPGASLCSSSFTPLRSMVVVINQIHCSPLPGGRLFSLWVFNFPSVLHQIQPEHLKAVISQAPRVPAEVLGPNRAQPWVPAAGILGRAGAPQPARHLPSLDQYYGSQCLFCPLFFLICFPLHSSLPCIRSQPSHLQAGIAALHPAHGGLAAFPAHCCSSGRRRGLQKYERILKTKASSVQ